jgi:hypothetical protein
MFTIFSIEISNFNFRKGITRKKWTDFALN